MYVSGGMIPTLILYRNLGLTGTFWVYVIPGMISVFNMLVLRTYMMGLPEGLEEKQILCSTEVYRRILQQWEALDTALVNIGDYPSSPDFASLVRYGSLLQRQRACGRMLIYYFNEDGFVIQSEQDFAIQIPIETLRQCPNIIGVCSANTSVKALEGALRTGIFTHLAARSKLVKALLDN